MQSALFLYAADRMRHVERVIHIFAALWYTESL